MEEWQPIPGLDGYEASSEGQIRSVDRWITYSDGRRRFFHGKILRLQHHPSGYLFLPNLGRVNRLVASAFHGKGPLGLVACHNDGDLRNNRADNLRWDTARENRLDQQRHGTDPKRNQVTCLRGHLLEGTNLRRVPLEQGRRECRSCAAARTFVARTPGTSLQIEADRYYERYMT